MGSLWCSPRPVVEDAWSCFLGCTAVCPLCSRVVLLSIAAARFPAQFSSLCYNLSLKRRMHLAWNKRRIHSLESLSLSNSIGWIRRTGSKAKQRQWCLECELKDCYSDTTISFLNSIFFQISLVRLSLWCLVSWIQAWVSSFFFSSRDCNTD